MQIFVQSGSVRQAVDFMPGDALADVLQRCGIHIKFPCAGNSTCGKCAARLGPDDVLLCNTRLHGRHSGAALSIPESLLYTADAYVVKKTGQAAGDALHLAIDIGTTTVCAWLLCEKSGKRVAYAKAQNPQCAYGADVISRIQAANAGRGPDMREAIRKCVCALVRKLLCGASADCAAVTRVWLVANTAMLHILAGASCAGLGVAPFVPTLLHIPARPFGEVFGGDMQAVVHASPCAAAFVGGDIVSGAWYYAKKNPPMNFLLLDIGTSGEVALCAGGRTYFASAAAGPAFEAGNIRMGMPAMPGAVSRARFDKSANAFRIKTIKNAPPQGICGTGVIEIAAGLSAAKLADSSGRMADSEVCIAIGADGGDIVFTQRDLREVQLAKSAMRTAIRVLLHEAHLEYAQIDKVLLAGAFGHRINPGCAAAIGIIPPQLARKTMGVGNAALMGARAALRRPRSRASQQKFVENAVCVDLVDHPLFFDAYVEYMGF